MKLKANLLMLLFPLLIIGTGSSKEQNSRGIEEKTIEVLHASYQLVADVDCSGVPLWTSGVVYSAGQYVVYQGKLYRVTISHLAVYGTPDMVPSLYQFIDDCE